MRRFSSWVKTHEFMPPTDVAEADVFKYAVDENGQWRGAAIYLYENDGWTVFEDLSAYYWTLPTTAWQDFAQSDDFVFAGYNDSIPYGALVVIEQGIVIREFLFNAYQPDENINQGQLVNTHIEPIESWPDAALFVDSDDLVYSDRGTLWLHGTAA